jgi:hypothetical protein
MEQRGHLPPPRVRIGSGKVGSSEGIINLNECIGDLSLAEKVLTS